MTAYCFKCKTKREIVRPTEVVLESGRKVLQGRCSVCKGKVSRMIGTEPRLTSPVKIAFLAKASAKRVERVKPAIAKAPEWPILEYETPAIEPVVIKPELPEFTPWQRVVVTEDIVVVRTKKWGTIKAGTPVTIFEVHDTHVLILCAELPADRNPVRVKKGQIKAV